MATKSDEAFAALVARHVNLVYSVAMRHVRNPHEAEEITQAVFIILSKKAHTLRTGAALPGWLYQTARLTSANYLRSKIRRQRREQEAPMQWFFHETGNDVWPRIAPVLDDAMAQLSDKDRSVVVQRFFEGKDLKDVSAALGVSPDAARMRVDRAVDKLRKFLARRGIVLSGAVIIGAICANSVQAAPPAVASSVTRAVQGAALPASTLSLVKGTLQVMNWLRLKIALSAFTAVIIIVIAVMIMFPSAGGSGGPALAARPITAEAANSISPGNTNDGHTALDILNSVQAKYDSLSSYRDTGTSVSEVDGSRSITTTFSIQLARPNLYRVEWEQPVHASFTNSGAVWSAGNWNYLLMTGLKYTRMESRDRALGGAAGISSAASSTIPSAFFNSPANLLPAVRNDKLSRKVDERLGGVDCYVVSGKLASFESIFWIGKQDSLIHRHRQITTNPNAPAGKVVVMTETHDAITINQPVNPRDFVREAPAGMKMLEE